MRGVGFDRLPPPPRPVPGRLRLALWLGGQRQLACLVVALAAPFAWLVTPHADWRSALFVGRPVVTAEATVLSSEPTGIRDGGKQGGAAVHRVRFRVAASGGRSPEGVSWGTQEHRAGDSAVVEFPEGRPELARIVGMRGAPLDPLALLVPAFFVLPLWVAIGGSPRLRRQARLLARGQFVLARLVESHGWSGPDGRKHWLPERVRNLPDGAPLPLLYDPARPGDAEPVTHFSWLVAIAPDGRLAVPRVGIVLWLLVLPGLALLSNLASVPLAGALR